MARGFLCLVAIMDWHSRKVLDWRLSNTMDGLSIDLKLVVADGALGFWAAMWKVWTNAREQRCWVHKTRNVLDKMPKTLQSEAIENPRRPKGGIDSPQGQSRISKTD